MNDDAQQASVRLDRWLWAARFFKTRAQASAAIRGGRVHLNAQRAKPAQRLRQGDRLEITRGINRFDVTVAGLGDRRGPATQAQALYIEAEASVMRREQARADARAHAGPRQSAGRPGKRARRELRKLSGKR